MRLINSTTYLLEEFFGDIPRYAILSHTWGNDEVSYQAWQAEPETTSRKQLSAKIRGACEQACRDGYEYLWCDTNCIDKTSSAELTEAINSMFVWYQQAAVCYAFLSDVDPLFEGDSAQRMQQFSDSRWFKRGWTLQELLAPQSVIFYDNTWTCIGNRSDRYLHGRISSVTRIRKRYLAPYGYDDSIGRKELDSASAAEKLSWLAERETTRIEDMAYCMLGIFDINMPLLYGEGQKAFVRLQEEIIKASNDQTIFCWRWDRSNVPVDWVSMLSPSPRTFKGLRSYKEAPLLRQRTLSYAMTNVGLSIKLPIVEYGGAPAMCLALLDVLDGDLTVAIPLVGPLGKDLYQRPPFPQGPIPLLVSTSAEDRDIKVYSRRGKLPKPLVPWMSEFDSFDYGVLFNYDDKFVSATPERQLMSQVPPWLILNILKLEALDQSPHFGCLLPLWVRSLNRDRRIHSKINPWEEEADEALIIITFRVTRSRTAVWSCQVIGIIDGPRRYEGYGSTAAGMETYHRACRNILRQMTDQRLTEPITHHSRSAKFFPELGLGISVHLGPSTKANERAQLSVARIHFSTIPTTSALLEAPSEALSRQG